MPNIERVGVGPYVLKEPSQVDLGSNGDYPFTLEQYRESLSSEVGDETSHHDTKKLSNSTKEKLSDELTSFAMSSVELEPWRIDAMCLDADPEIFFPEKGEPGNKAKKICQACPVSQECLDFSIANDERHGIWGGLGEKQRRVIRRENSKEAKVA